MYNSKKTFLEAKLEDELDRAAQRALVLDAELIELQLNARNAGYFGGIEACNRARGLCLLIFAMAHKQRSYSFVAEVSDGVAQLAESIDMERMLAVDELLVGLELGMEQLREALPPVTTVVGGGVQIVRGDFVTLAMRDVVAANQNTV